VEGVEAAEVEDMVIIGGGSRMPSRMDGLGPPVLPNTPDPADE